MTRNEAIRILEYGFFDVCGGDSADAIDAIEFAIDDMKAMRNNGWVNAKERLPELSGFYLVFRLNDGMYVEYFAQHTSTWFMEDADEDYGVAYWMLLPEEPKEVEANG